MHSPNRTASAFHPTSAVLYRGNRCVLGGAPPAHPRVRRRRTRVDGSPMGACSTRSRMGTPTAFAVTRMAIYGAGSGRRLLHCRRGTLLGKIRVPSTVANVAFGGLKKNRLFIAHRGHCTRYTSTPVGFRSLEPLRRPEGAEPRGTGPLPGSGVSTVADLDRSEVFYRDCFGFETPRRSSHECDWPALTGIASCPAPGEVGRASTLEGRSRARLLPARKGAAILPDARPPTRGSSISRLWSPTWIGPTTPFANARISRRLRNGPERLPPNTGSVTAYKFRDPEGHPIELTMFPPGVGSAEWDQTPGSLNAVFLGIDHSAIAVASSTGAIAFYRGLLGMSVPFQTTNRGPEQGAA